MQINVESSNLPVNRRSSALQTNEEVIEGNITDAKFRTHNNSSPESAVVQKISANNPMEKIKTVGRNDLCPCGSGKKYKKCCGK